MRRQQGFTLIEMAIVLVIITILIGGLAVPLSAQIQARRIAETNKTLEEAREAIVGFARTRGGTLYLPCPDTDGDGIENRTGALCDAQVGGLPWITLGTGQQDAWANRLRYEVDNNFSASSGFNETTSLDETARSVKNVASEVVFVVVSHGPNRSGATNTNGIALPPPTGADELDNLDANRIYVSHEQTKASATSEAFDDLLAWISLSQLIPRACPNGCP
ncbi:MAG: prepilin-type N-terminal cleavage/methylation domain-containing protein [Thiobacillus sp.]